MNDPLSKPDKKQEDIAHYGKSLISVFQQFFTIIGKIFILAGRLGTRLPFYEVYTLSWYLLIS